MTPAEYEAEEAILVAAMKYPYVDPDQFKDRQVEMKGYVAVKNEAAHVLARYLKPYHTDGLEKIDGCDWELFRTRFSIDVDGQTYYYGMFAEGLGFFDVMVAAENVRELTDGERSAFSNKGYAIVGFHSGKTSYTGEFSVTQ